VSVKEIIREIEALPAEDRVRVIEFVHGLEDSEIPESFRTGMADIEAGRVVDIGTHALYR
jgi:hypothetical protein